MARTPRLGTVSIRRFYATRSKISTASSLFEPLSKNDFLEPKSRGNGLNSHGTENVHPSGPARTRFAPSPTGFLHLGSLRTALYNFLLARATTGEFVLRVEDTDQTRKKEGAEQNIYESLKWAGISWDEGPVNGGPYGPYRQSERLDIYRKYANQLIQSGHAYKCFCSRERLAQLLASAQKLTPPSMATYDRHCYHLDPAECERKASGGEAYTVRLKSPEKYPKVNDLLHGDVDLQVQINYADTRYDDPVLLKTDGYPTYHLASVIDDHLMKITHVIRGEEWLPSTPKHLAIYDAFGWTPPQFVHIPLLTSLEDKKLSKRTGDIGISEYAMNGVLPEALVNFVALFGWSPSAGVDRPQRKRQNIDGEILSMEKLIEKFNLNGLTKGNAKVSESKLEFFNAHYLKALIETPDGLDMIARKVQPLFIEKFSNVSNDRTKFELDYIRQVVSLFKGKIHYTKDLPDQASYVFTEFPDWGNSDSMNYIQQLSAKNEGMVAVSVIEEFLVWLNSREQPWTPAEIENFIQSLVQEKGYKSSIVFQSLRFAVSGSIPGAPLSQLMILLDKENVRRRLVGALGILKL
ncbi:tRNA synthetases class I, catalytic domain-containing protein [Lipomyces kononenkoae]|uniref:tRNA synthetases class I, catalytic domain-containing protein n=1 Tax=Lipomyces kononenkoae TaxID=34357 RepID=A0ACC3T387_LIPKO